MNEKYEYNKALMCLLLERIVDLYISQQSLVDVLTAFKSGDGRDIILRDRQKAIKELNTGECGVVATAVALAFRSLTGEEVQIGSTPRHAFVVWDNKYYDTRYSEGFSDYNDPVAFREDFLLVESDSGVVKLRSIEEFAGAWLTDDEIGVAFINLFLQQIETAFQRNYVPDTKVKPRIPYRLKVMVDRKVELIPTMLGTVWSDPNMRNQYFWSELRRGALRYTGREFHSQKEDVEKIISISVETTDIWHEITNVLDAKNFTIFLLLETDNGPVRKAVASQNSVDPDTRLVEWARHTAHHMDVPFFDNRCKPATR